MTKHKEPIQDDTLELATETLTGDIRDFLLDRIKNFPKPWSAMTEGEQRDQILMSETAARRLVASAIHLIAAEGRKVIVGQLEQVVVKNEIKAVITLPKTDPCRHELMDSQGQAVLIVVTNTEAFIGEKAPAETDPEQPDMLNKAA